MSTVAKVLLYDDSDNILVLRRSGTHPRYPHEADLPGGMVEDGEDTDVAVCREIHEETGLSVNKSNVMLIHSRTTPEGRKDTLYAAKLDSVKPDIAISSEHEAGEWIPAANLDNNIDTSDDYMIVVKEYLSKQ